VFPQRLPAPPALLLVLATVVACATVPLTGRTQLLLLPESQELAMGLQSYKQVLAKERVSTDPARITLVQRVGRRIAEATGRTDFEWEFKVIENDKMVNAFCLPGGKVAVYTGILPITKDEAGLAAVMGHEVAHAIARHGGERVSQTLLVQVGIATVAAAMNDKDPRTTQLVAGLLGAGATLGVLLPFSREHESEADHLGLIYMAKAGYDPHAARDVWVRMAEHSKGREKPPEFLSTHPADATRIKQIEDWIPEALTYYRTAHAR
jgi:predicted Zn-dependent protease